MKGVGSRTDGRLTFCRPPKSKQKSATPAEGMTGAGVATLVVGRCWWLAWNCVERKLFARLDAGSGFGRWWSAAPAGECRKGPLLP